MTKDLYPDVNSEKAPLDVGGGFVDQTLEVDSGTSLEVIPPVNHIDEDGDSYVDTGYTVTKGDVTYIQVRNNRTGDEMYRQEQQSRLKVKLKLTLTSDGQAKLKAKGDEVEVASLMSRIMVDDDPEPITAAPSHERQHDECYYSRPYDDRYDERFYYAPGGRDAYGKEPRYELPERRGGRDLHEEDEFGENREQQSYAQTRATGGRVKEFLANRNKRFWLKMTAGLLMLDLIASVADEVGGTTNGFNFSPVHAAGVYDRGVSHVETLGKDLWDFIS